MKGYCQRTDSSGNTVWVPEDSPYLTLGDPDALQDLMIQEGYVKVAGQEMRYSDWLSWCEMQEMTA